MAKSNGNTVTLQAAAKFGFARKQFVARITGRGAGRFPLEFDFLGRAGGKRGEDTEALVDDPGLYVERDIDSKGRSTDTYYIIWARADGLDYSVVEESDVMGLAKSMDADEIRAFALAEEIALCRRAIATNEEKLAAGELLVTREGVTMPREERIAQLRAEIASIERMGVGDADPRAAAVAQIRALMTEHSIAVSDLA